MEEAKKDILEKDKLLSKSSAKKGNLETQVEVVKQALKDAKFLLWDNITKEVKKLKDHLIILHDERELVITCLSNVSLVQESMGDKPIQAQKAINFLNSQSKKKLQFAGIQDRAELIAQEKSIL